MSDIKPITIFSLIKGIDNEPKFMFNEEGLSKLLLNPKCADKKVCIVSVAGALRGGKSLLLNLFLRNLKWMAKGNGDWLANNNHEDNGDDVLDGFEWGASMNAVTEGILLWPEPFIVKNAAGEEIAVFLMDTQGIFDNNSTIKSCTTIFALSTFISSVQVYNIKGGSIQMDQLQHLQMFTEYAQMAMENNDNSNEAKPFQKLLFLVRDWPNSHQLEYGLNGGQKYVDDVLKIGPTLSKEQNDLRQSIRQSFASVQCFLMPHPGLDVTEPEFRGQLNKIREQFKVQLRSLASHLFDGDKLVVKSIMNTNPVTCRQLFGCIQNYFHIFNTLPEPMDLINAMAMSFNQFAVDKSMQIYQEEMEKKCGDKTPFFWLDRTLGFEHHECMDTALGSFDGQKKFGSVDLVAIFRAKLTKGIEAKRAGFQRVYEAKCEEEENRRREEANRRREEEIRRFKEINRYEEIRRQAEASRRQAEASHRQKENLRQEENRYQEKIIRREENRRQVKIRRRDAKQFGYY